MRGCHYLEERLARLERMLPTRTNATAADTAAAPPSDSQDLKDSDEENEPVADTGDVGRRHASQPDAFKTPQAQAAGVGLDPFLALNSAAIQGTPFATARPSAHTDGSDSVDGFWRAASETKPVLNRESESNDSPTPMPRENVDAHVKTRRHTSFQEPLTERRAVRPRHRNLPRAALFNHQEPQGFNFGNDSKDDDSSSSPPTASSAPDVTLASFASRPYASLNRIRAAVAEGIPLGSAKSIIK